MLALKASYCNAFHNLHRAFARESLLWYKEISTDLFIEILAVMRITLGNYILEKHTLLLESAETPSKIT